MIISKLFVDLSGLENSGGSATGNKILDGGPEYHYCFDLPVLRYRVVIHSISAPGLFVRPYFNR
jgi:hypothetical protein